jgi:proliferating cell nuclear antigen
MTFHAVAEVDVLEDALDPVATIVDECKLRLNEDGLSIRAVDPANVGMADVDLPERAFETYEADGGVIGVNLDRLQDVLSMGSSGDLAELRLDEETRKLNIEIGELAYTLALIDPDTVRKEPDIPDLDLPADVAFEGSELGRAVSAAGLVGDHVSLAADPDAHEFVVAAEGDTDDVEVVLGDEELVDADVPEAAESLFSLDYLEDMTRPIGSDVIVSFRLGSEMPVKFRYTNGEARVQHLLAPRIDSS